MAAAYALLDGVSGQLRVLPTRSVRSSSAKPADHRAPCCSTARSFAGNTQRLRASVQSARRGSRAQARAADAAYQPFPFDERDYYRAHLQLVQSSDPYGVKEGNLVFMKEGETVYDTGKRALVLSVGGDTLAGVANLVQSRELERPMSLDLLWQILARGQDVSRHNWRLLRVAIVELRHDVYYGRLFFGDAEGNATVWDCDCRPSDACWLSLKAGCPVFVKCEVWDEHAVRLSDLMSSSEEGDDPQGQQGGPPGGHEEEASFSGGPFGGRDGSHPPSGAAVAAAAGYAEAAEAELGYGGYSEEEASGTALLTRIRKSDPDPIKRLKREMEVALSEEDYAAAARIRDHPFMQLHVRLVEAARGGNAQRARALEVQLQRAIEDADRLL